MAERPAQLCALQPRSERSISTEPEDRSGLKPTGFVVDKLLARKTRTMHIQRLAIYGNCFLAGLFCGSMAYGNETDMAFHLEGKPNPVLASDALSMSDLREVCFVTQYYSAADLLRIFKGRTVTGRTIPDSTDYERKTNADEIGIFAITDRGEKLLIVKARDGSVPNGKDDGGCFRAEDARIWHWPDGSWYLNSSDRLQVYPWIGIGPAPEEKKK